MTVGALIEALTECDRNAQVVLATDAEGNDFKSLDGEHRMLGFAEDYGRWEVREVEDAPEDGSGDLAHVVVLWPI